jgi:ribosomal protein S18 acetylase RimI-like enzyme
VAVGVQGESDGGVAHHLADHLGVDTPGQYAHKVTVDRAYGGQGLGAELLDWAGTRAADEGADWLRVDVWTTNERLQHYYLKQGFTYVRTVVLPHNPSGALFQRPAQLPTPHLQEVESLTG